mgnify:CR=1 FL=1
MSAEERKTSIVKAAIPLFAELGFKGTTTRKIADTANISEALLYKHFPSKEELYKSIQDSCFSVREDTLTKLYSIEDDTKGLIFCLYIFIRRSLKREYSEEQHLKIIDRLTIYSLLEDGEFAQTLKEKIWQPWFNKAEACYHAAIASGDLKVKRKNSSHIWFVHHQIVSVLLLRLSPTEMIDYQASDDELIEDTLNFSLRGLGLKADFDYDINSLHSFYNEQFIAL